MKDTKIEELKKYKEFYLKIAKLALFHEVINDTACVTVAGLGKELGKINKEWWKVKEIK